MARDFNKTTTEHFSWGVDHLAARWAGSGAMSGAAWIYANSFDSAGNDNHITHAVATGASTYAWIMNIDGGAPNQLRIGGRSVHTDSFQSSTAGTINTGQWHHVGGCLDFTNGQIRVYVDGSEVADTSVTFGQSTYTDTGTPTGKDTISTDGTTTQDHFDGLIAETCFWDVDIGAEGFATLAAGFSPFFVKPTNLLNYVRLLGAGDASGNDRDLISGVTVTENATIGTSADHPPIIDPGRRHIILPVAVIGGAIVCPIVGAGGIASVIFGGQVIRG